MAADAGAGDDGGAFPQIGGPFDAGVGDGFARGDCAVLREAVEEGGLFGVEVAGGVPAADFGAVCEAQNTGRNAFERSDGGAALR